MPEKQEGKMSHTGKPLFNHGNGEKRVGDGEGGRVLMTSVDKELQSQGSPPPLGGISHLFASCLFHQEP